MIVGSGFDICDVKRIAKVLAKPYSQNFKSKVFTLSEIEYCEKFVNPSQNYAVRWAVKEAFYKALPYDLQDFSSWKSMEFLNFDGKKPFINVCDLQLHKKMQDLGISNIHCSVSHEKELCAAFVILEKTG
jgi:holo-[acyl-carrier protein] synthase